MQMKSIKKIATLILFVALALPALAQGLLNNSARIVMTNGANIYINGTTGNYVNQGTGLITSSTTGGVITVIGNWTNNASNAAFSNDGVTVNLSGAAQSIDGSASTTFYNLSLLGSGTKTLNVSTTVGGISTLTGVLAVGARTLDLNSNTLTITNPATGGITYGAGMIISETNLAINPSRVQWNMGTSTGSHVYPFGVSGTQIPFTFNKTTAGASNITVSTRATASSNNQPWAGASNVAAVSTMQSNAGTYYADASIPSVVDRWWDITTSAAVTANLIFTYRGVENTTTNNPTGTLQAQHWNGSSWDAPTGSGSGVTAGVGTVSVTGASTFSPWIISSLMIPLPVELADFKSTCLQRKKILEWTTTTEINNDYFLLEKSADGLNYNVFAQVNSKAPGGNSNQLLSYSFADEDAASQQEYYRLRQIDINGNNNISKVIQTENCSAAGNEVEIYNQEQQGFEVTINAQQITSYHLKVYNALGQLLFSSVLETVEGTNKFSFPMNVDSGIYYISIADPGSVVCTKKVML